MTADRERRRFRAALSLQQAGKLEAEYRAGRVLPQPSRITTALDAAGLQGPHVDQACLAVEPAVDRWEAGLDAPTWEQLAALADLTGFTPAFLCREPTEPTGPITVCGAAGCHVVEPTPVVAPADASLAKVLPLRRRRPR